jgi:hypothetical protein
MLLKSHLTCDNCKTSSPKSLSKAFPIQTFPISHHLNPIQQKAPLSEMSCGLWIIFSTKKPHLLCWWLRKSPSQKNYVNIRSRGWEGDFWFDKLFVSLLLCFSSFSSMRCGCSCCLWVIISHSAEENEISSFRRMGNCATIIFMDIDCCFPIPPKGIYLLLRAQYSFLMLHNDDAVGTEASRATRCDS